METLAVRIASLTPVTVKGTWLRHSDAGYPQRALDGHAGYGRWGTKRGFDVLYLGEPEPSVVVEAYRHFIDPIEDPAMLAEIRPRILVTAGVTVDEVLDLTSAGARMTTGLSLEILQSDTDDREAYERCQEVAQVAHQLGRRGILAPAATK
ncbi:RES domain-containing protein [uncultured Jatrophihabitans sp.]|uniref:RES domain-containing protein n=1 Tax=uncultured Jatrophihabitans sp. TaxID=1610747 RepID=UPI0035CC82AA